MHEPNVVADRRLRVGSLFSGYGGLDIAVEQVFDARTVWFSEINERVARVFAHHWPDAPNLGDITTINWNEVEPVDVLCGGFPCQDVSTVGRMAGLSPGTRSGLWGHMATAIEALRPEWVVIENVRGLLSAPATRPRPEGDDDERHSAYATAGGATLRNLEPDRGVWETSQPDLYGHLAPYSETWPTSGMTHDGSAYPLPQSARRMPGSESSSSPTPLFRTPLAADSTRGGETLDHVRARRGTIALSHQVIDLIDLGGRPAPEAILALVEDFLDAGDAMPER